MTCIGINYSLKLEERNRYLTNINSKVCVMFTEYRGIQHKLHCLDTKPDKLSSKTAPCTVSFLNEKYQSTNCL